MAQISRYRVARRPPREAPCAPVSGDPGPLIDAERGKKRLEKAPVPAERKR